MVTKENRESLALRSANWVQAMVVPLLYAVFFTFCLLLAVAWFGHVLQSTSISSGTTPRGMVDAATAVVYLVGVLSGVLTVAMALLTASRPLPTLVRVALAEGSSLSQDTPVPA